VVQRYGGTAEYTGDGVMGLFGAPVALEDHAFRGCLAALALQEEANRLAAEVARRDGVALRLRVGLNSGWVIAGEIGSGSLGYAATGQHVGMAQRMESVAPPGGVMLLESTARLVETHRDAVGVGVGAQAITSPRGSRLGLENWKRSVNWKAAITKIGRDAMRVHDLRHTYASLSRRAGADLRLVHKAMGHASITVTAHTYADLFDDELDNIAAALDSLDDISQAT